MVVCIIPVPLRSMFAVFHNNISNTEIMVNAIVGLKKTFEFRNVFLTTAINLYLKTACDGVLAR
jgi:hypothetical protein